jgi:hypothetical protein
MGITNNGQLNISHHDFHDGYLIDLKHNKDSLEISMESAQIDLDDLRDNIQLSKHRTLKGKLHIKHIKEFKINDDLFFGEFKKPRNDGEIFEFGIKNNRVKLTINWLDHPPQSFDTNMWCTYEILAEEIYWENIPNLHNPYWLDKE